MDLFKKKSSVFFVRADVEGTEIEILLNLNDGGGKSERVIFERIN